jgi:hypothetical protein
MKSNSTASMSNVHLSNSCYTWIGTSGQHIQPNVVRYVSLDLCLLLLRLLVRSYVKGELIGKYVA